LARKAWLEKLKQHNAVAKEKRNRRRQEQIL
jgi:hypothetical protein